MNLLDVVDGEGWSIQQAIQTTFPFDPQFYSSYVRPRLHKRNCDLPLVLIDGGRYEREITSSDWGEAPIGTDYLLEPVDSTGVFHPKVNLFASERSVYFSVSSANLTLEEYCKAAQIGYADGFQKSWLTDDDKREVGEVYHLAKEVREFYAALVDREGLITGQDATNYVTETVTTLEWLDDVADDIETSESERTTRLISNLSGPILSQVTDYVGDVERAQLYAPFYGTPNVVRQIANRLDASRLELLVESESTALDVAGLPDALDGVKYAVRELEPQSAARWVHAKFLVLDGEWGQACLFGSPNMTSSALLESASQGNVEAGLLAITPDVGETSAMRRAMFEADSFRFDVSDPVEDPSALDLRSASYEGWESIRKRERDQIRLKDARLTQPGADDESDLILVLAGIDGEHEFTVSTDEGDEKILTGVVSEENAELSVTLQEGERAVWADAVVTVEADGRSSNPRRVVEKMQAYYREYREITRSSGTRSSNTLLREILQNPDMAAIGTFDIAISELRQSAKGASTSARAPAEETEEAYPERSAANLSSSYSSLPSLSTLIRRHLAYHREQGIAALDLEDRPRPENVEAFVDHTRTFWETIELCFTLEKLGQLDTERIDESKLFGICEKQLQHWFEALISTIRRLNGLIDQVENVDSVREAFIETGEGEAAELEIWSSVFELVFMHPGLVLEFEMGSDSSVFGSKNCLANRIATAFDEVHHHISQHLLDGEELKTRTKTLIDNLSVEFETSGDEVDLTGRAVQALVLYVLVQDIGNSDSFVTRLQNRSRVTDDAVAALIEFAFEADEAIVEYGLVSSLQWSIVLQEQRRELEELG